MDNKTGIDLLLKAHTLWMSNDTKDFLEYAGEFFYDAEILELERTFKQQKITNLHRLLLWYKYDRKLDKLPILPMHRRMLVENIKTLIKERQLNINHPDYPEKKKQGTN